MITSTGIFSFFQNFDFRVARGIKGQKIVENDKRILSIVLHISGTIHHMIIICGVQVQNHNIFRYFFYFFKTLIFQVVRRVKGQKMAQNDKKLCLSCLISQEPYIIWSSFMVHMCNRIISPGFFKIYSKFLFLGSIVG